MKRAVPWIRVAGFIVGLVVLVAIFDYAFAQTGYVRYVLTYFCLLYTSPSPRDRG